MGKLSLLVPAGGDGRAWAGWRGQCFPRNHTGSGSGEVLQMSVLAQTHKGGKFHPAEEGRNGKQIGTGDPEVLCIFTCALCSPGLSVVAG